MSSKIFQYSALTWVRAWTGTLARMLGARWIQTTLTQRSVEDDLGRADHALAAVGDDEQRVAQPAGFEPRKKPAQASWLSELPGSMPKNTGFPADVMPQATSTGRGPRVHAEVAAVGKEVVDFECPTGPGSSRCRTRP
jgi:hypothetical protein